MKKITVLATKPTSNFGGIGIVDINEIEETITFVDMLDNKITKPKTVRLYSTISGKLYFNRYGIRQNLNDYMRTNYMKSSYLEIAYDEKTLEII